MTYTHTDGELHDDHDSSRDGNRGVYGYWHKAGVDR